MRSSWLVALLFAQTAATASSVHAEPRRIAVDTPVEAFTTKHGAAAAPYLYLNRCSGGCTINGNSCN